MSRNSKHSSDDNYDDHEPINPKNEDSGPFGALFSACCGPCYQWYMRHTHQKLVNTLQQSEHDEDWGLGRDSSGAMRLSPKQTKELTSFDHRRSGDESENGRYSTASPASFSVSVTSDDRTQRKNRINKGIAASSSSSGHGNSDRPSAFHHDTDVLLAVTAGSGDDGEDVTLASTMRPTFGASKAQQESTHSDDEILEDYMASTHQSHHGMSSYFRSSDDSDDSLEKEMEKQLRNGGGSGFHGITPNSNTNSRGGRLDKRDEGGNVLAANKLCFSLDGDDMAVL